MLLFWERGFEGTSMADLNLGDGPQPLKHLCSLR